MSVPQLSGPAARRLVWPLAATIGVAFGALLYGFSVLITREAAGGEFSSTVLSLAFSGAVVAGGAAALPVGRVADRHGIRGILALGAGLVAAGFGVFALATEPWHVLAAWWLLIGPGSAMVLFDPAFIALEQWFDREARNRAAGTLTLLTGLAGPIFVPATYAMVGAFGWRATAAALGGLVAVTGWLTAWLALGGAPRPRPLGQRALTAVRDLAKAPRFVLLTLALLGLFAAMESIQIHRLARFEAAGFAAPTLAFWAAFASVASLPGRFLVPRVASRFAAWRVLLVVVVLLIPAFALTVRASTTAEMVGHFVLFGAFFGATIPMRTVVMGDWFAGPRFGALMGVQGLAIAAGRASGPASVGWLTDRTGGYEAAMLALTVLVAVVALLLAASGRAWRTDGRGPPPTTANRRENPV